MNQWEPSARLPCCRKTCRLTTTSRHGKQSSHDHTWTSLDFAEMAAEFDWARLCGDRTGCEIGRTIGINLCLGLLPTLSTWLWTLAVRDYINGTYYYKQTGSGPPSPPSTPSLRAFTTPPSSSGSSSSSSL